MTITSWIAIAIVILTVVALIKRYETRLVLLASGFLMAAVSLKPMAAFQQFDKSMTNGSLIIAICSALGFAAVISCTKCDVHLVALLTKPLKKLGIMLLPACCLITGFVSIAIPSTAGCCAAVAPTLLPVMIRAGFRPAIAAAAIVSSITPALLNPGVSHNAFVAKLAGIDVMQFIQGRYAYTLGFAAIVIVGILAACLMYRDFRREGFGSESETLDTNGTVELPSSPNILYAIAPLVPIAILLTVSLGFHGKCSVSTAMLVGAAYAILITRVSPAEATKKFFDGMGSGYGKILGIIIAAGVFASGLRAAGLVDAFVNYLTHAQDVARIGGAFGPYLLGVLTGSGDAATFAFNEAVTPYAEQFGMTIENLGYLATIGGHLGRLSSPLCGGLILVAGLAGVNPFDIAKRTAPAMLLTLIVAICIL